ncbi:hypothetical protein Tco_1187208 [Tanacetum coccineum]
MGSWRSSCYVTVNQKGIVIEGLIYFDKQYMSGSDGRKVHFWVFIDFGATVLTSLKEIKCVLRIFLAEFNEAEMLPKLDDVDDIIPSHRKWKKMKLFQDMQLNQKLRDDQKIMKKSFEDVSGSYVQKSNQDRDLR